MEKRNATVAVIGAGDYIGTEIAKKFAAEGFTVFAGRRDGAKLEPLVRDIEAAGGSIVARALDAREADEVAAFLNDADKHAPLEVCIFNVGANVNFPVLETTDRVFRKVWEMACWAGFVAGRESARLMLPHGKGNIFFTGATASLRGGSGFAAFASAKFGLRAVAQAMARELGPKNIHVAHLPGPLSWRSARPGKSGKRTRIADSEWDLPYSLFATPYSPLTKELNKCAFSWSVPAPSADISAAGCCRLAAM